MRSLIVVVLVVLVRCGAPVKPCEGDACAANDGGTLDAGPVDAGGHDAGVVDAGERDAGLGDAGTPDSGGLDGSEPDAGPIDAGPSDAGAVDGGDAGATEPDAGTDGGTDAGTVARVRLMAANLTAGLNQNYNPPPGDTEPGPGIRIMQGARPDIVMVQEFRFGADDADALQEMAEHVIGPGAHWCREMAVTGDLPNGVISRYPIVACGEWDDSRINNRDYLWARIDVPGPEDLWAISVHFSTQATNRPTEGLEIVQNVMSHIDGGALVVLGGDLNTDDEGEPVFTTLAQVFTIFPQPTDQFGNPGTNTNRNIRLADGGLDPVRNQPYDWVLPTPNLRALEVPITLTDGVHSISVPNGFVIDTRVFDAGNIGLITPAQLSDSAALNMQHMGVIRDFALPQ